MLIMVGVSGRPGRDSDRASKTVMGACTPKYIN